jgi:NADH-quinone oxidoreductase subunit K
MIFTLPAFLTVGLALFVIGLYVVLVRRNMISMLMGIELMLNGAALNFISFGAFQGGNDGAIMTLFVIALAALETVVLLAIVFAIFKGYRTVSIDRASALHD